MVLSTSANSRSTWGSDSTASAGNTKLGGDLGELVLQAQDQAVHQRAARLHRLRPAGRILALELLELPAQQAAEHRMLTFHEQLLAELRQRLAQRLPSAAADSRSTAAASLSASVTSPPSPSASMPVHHAAGVLAMVEGEAGEALVPDQGVPEPRVRARTRAGRAGRRRRSPARSTARRRTTSRSRAQPRRAARWSGARGPFVGGGVEPEHRSPAGRARRRRGSASAAGTGRLAGWRETARRPASTGSLSTG